MARWRKSNRTRREMSKCCKLHEAWALGDLLHSTRVREQAASYQDPPYDPRDTRCDDLWDHPSDAYDYELTGGGTLYYPLGHSFVTRTNVKEKQEVPS